VISRVPSLKLKASRPADEVEQGRRNLPFALFCAFIVGYYLHITARIPMLGKLHYDLVLASIVALMIVLSRRAREQGSEPHLDPVAKRLWILVGYIIATIPFVEWPGSVVHNLETYAKSLCFLFFVLATVDTTRKLRVLFAVYCLTQVFRVLEPLYMHVRWGYWGSYTSLENWEYMDRLAGSPFDTVNGNGLAFVILTTLPILHFVVKPNTSLRFGLWVAIAGAMCYALVLTASRSGFLALIFLCLFMIFRSKHRVAWLVVAAAGAVLAVSAMTDLQRDRYLSIVSHETKAHRTAEGRINGVIGDFKVSLRRPLFGHGLGTSREANWHFRGADLPSHDLYTETAEELGYIGLVLFLSLLWSFLGACWAAQRIVRAKPATDERLEFLHNVAATLVVLVAVDLFFSLASYGLSEPYWYFLGGLSVVTARLAVKLTPGVAQENVVKARRDVKAARRDNRAPFAARVPPPGVGRQ
jgi:hypothetical protein